MRKTKIICTIGPACTDESVLKEMCKAGMNVARLNFSHGTYDDHKQRIDLIKKIRTEMDLPIAIMLDTKGPEYRIKTFEKGKIELKDGDLFSFTTDEIIGNEKRVSVTYKGLIKDLSVGDKILLNNGLLSFRVTELTETDAICETVIGGILSDRKSMSFPGKVLKQIYLSEQDKSDILFGINNDIDFISCSFVSCKQDLLDVKEFINANGGDNIGIIAKIENQAGIDNIEEICSECEGIMIGRGDMGVEIPFESLPAIQKRLITKCRLLGKRIITATEMLESMISSPRPTRAEISDVANAVYDGTSAIMLSGETAAGKYPVLTVKTMSDIAEHTENNIHYSKRFKNSSFEIRNTVDAVSHATCTMAIDINAKAIVACTLSGGTARMVSRFRSPVDIIGLTTNEKTYRKLALSWGVIPAKCEVYNSTDVLFFNANRTAKSILSLNNGDKIIITGGITNGSTGNTDTIKIDTI
ncbi:MAG: pyruvate kinase [Clostridia bacterium]|nr:pyruvate kinase [Clostridia bacterium]